MENTIDFATAERMISEHGGRFFGVEFIKRTDGSRRRMVARTGVKPTNDVPKRERGYIPAHRGLIVVWEPTNGYAHMGKGRDEGYRSIPIEGIRKLTMRGQTYIVSN